MKEQKKINVFRKSINLLLVSVVIEAFLFSIAVYAIRNHIIDEHDIGALGSYPGFYFVALGFITVLLIDFRAYRKLRRYALTDIFTGLNNGHSFIRIANRYIITHRQACFLVLWFDIHNLHLINQRYSMEKGDELLLLISDSLKKSKLIYSAARVKGDNFAVLIEKCEGKGAEEVVAGLLAALKQRILTEKGINVDFIVGGCIYNKEIGNGEDVLEKAHIAQNIAREKHLPLMLFNEEIKNKLLEEDKLAEEILSGLGERQFSVYYQPKYNIVNGEMTGAEALVRWNHPEKGFISPSKFLKIASKKGVLGQIDDFVFEQVCKDIQKWRKSGMYVPVSVNCEKNIFISPGLFDKRLRLMEKYAIEKGEMQFEITERTAFEDASRAESILKELKGRGFSIAIDDFGVEYSSLSMLRSLPVDTVKLDKSFIKRGMLDEMNKKMISSFLDIFNTLGLEAVAEGVETLEELAFLKECGISCVQGYLLDFPLKEEDLFNRFKTGEVRLKDKDVLEIISTSPAPSCTEYDKDSSSFYYRNILIKGEIDFIEADLTSNLIIYNGANFENERIAKKSGGIFDAGKSYTLAVSYFLRTFVAEEDKRAVALFLSKRNIRSLLSSGVCRDNLRFSLKTKDKKPAFGELSLVLKEENNKSYAIIKYTNIKE